jgi:alpha-L-rhamnosidase
MSICPWTMYMVYGDRELIARQYEAVKRHVNFLRDHRSLDLIRSHPDLDVFTGFGDWLATDAGREIVWGLTPKEIVGTAYLSYSAKLASKMAHALGHAEEERFYKDLSEKVAQRFVERFVTKDGLVSGNTQTSYVLALHFGLLPEKLRPIAANELVRRINERGGHISTGFVGSAYVLHALSNSGKLDVAYKLLREKTYPSWLYPVTQGATTIWERWDGWTTDKGFQDPGMNSFNHYAYGAVGDWMYQVVAGIEVDPLKPGYEHLLLQPRPGGGLTHAAATLDTRYGTVKSAWKLDGNKLTWHVTVPPNTHATVRVPTTDPASVTEAGKAIDAKTKSATQEAGAVTLSLGAGEYVFTATH